MKTKHIVLVGIAVAVAFFLLKPKPKRSGEETTLRMELLPNVNSPTNKPVYFKYPTNGAVWFVLAQGSDTEHVFDGTLTVATNGGVVCQKTFSSSDLKRCDWLYDKHAPTINAFALNYSNGPDSKGNWPLEPEKTYSAAITILPTNATPISLWLCWFGK
jgi:hypothetical protein